MKLRKLLIFIGFFVHTVSCEKEGSLTFVIDNTASMRTDIEHVKLGVDKIMDVILTKKSSQIEDIVLVRFNDPHYEKLITTRDRKALKTVLYSLRAWNIRNLNKDCPEMALHGIKLALESSKDNSQLFVFTDASPKDFQLTKEVIQLAQKKSSQVVFIITEGIHCGERPSSFYPYYEIANATFGQVLKINVKNEIEKVIDYIAETCSGERTVLVQTDIPAYRKQRVLFDIDDQTEYVIISASGNSVGLDWRQIRNFQGTVEEITWLDNFKAVKLIVHEPGRYSVTVWGASATSVIVYGRTNFKFHYGFSMLPVKSLINTTKNPIAGENHHLAISVNDPDGVVSVESVALLDMNKNVLMNLSLNRKSPDFYTTKLFLPPISTFLIAVLGTGKYSHRPVKRISKTPIQPRINEFEPIITVDHIKNTYEYNSKFNLNCNVKGHPKPQILWIEENGNTVKTANIRENPPYDYNNHLIIEKLKISQLYTCHARNQLGRNSKNVYVNVDSPFVVKKHLEDVTDVAYEKEIELICDIKSKWPMKISWWKNGELVTSHVSNDGTKLTIKKANIDDQGIYICEAKLLEDDPTIQYQTELKISGLILPHIEKQTAFLIIKKAEPVTLTCKITKGFPAPKRVWKFKEIGSDKWITITNSEEHLMIERSQLRSGKYKCLASNVIGHDEMDIKLAVEVPPEIEPSERTVYALELDLVLRIPCDTVGYPKPIVTWRVNGSIIEMGKRYKLDKKTLVILNPVKNDSGKYTCKVENQFGSDSKTTEAIVKSNDIPFIINPNMNDTTTTNPILYQNIEKKDRNTNYILEGSIISLDCPHAKDDAVRWYKDYQYLNITGSPLVIKKATTKDDGIYNCRASNYYGTQSHSFKINVGYKPRGNTKPDIIYKDGSLDQTLSKSLECQFDVKPMTNEIEWTFNGERINENTTDFNGEINWGIYTCSITNPHGTAKRTFTVISNDCLIKKSQITKNAPLILTEDLTWPDIYYNENYLRLPRNMNSKLFCPNQKGNHIHFERFSKINEILATCVGENKFSVNGTIVKFEDLQCNLPIQYIVNETGAKCLNDNTELVKVGFEVDQFVEVYEICVDKTKMVPLYTRIDMTPLYNIKITPLENARVNEFNGDKCGDGSKCCFGKTQLVSKRDVRFGPSQAATLIDMNYVPYWRPCDEKLGWNDIEENITRKLEQIEVQFIIWSGASNYTTKSDVIVPRYLWKVINVVGSEYSFSVVYVNDPTPTVEDKLCEDICSKFDWITSSESTYCCRLEEFQKAFHVPDKLAIK